MFTYVDLSGAWPENRFSTHLTSMALRLSQVSKVGFAFRFDRIVIQVVSQPVKLSVRTSKLGPLMPLNRLTVRVEGDVHIIGKFS